MRLGSMYRVKRWESQELNSKKHQQLRGRLNGQLKKQSQACHKTESSVDLSALVTVAVIISPRRKAT